MFLHTHQTSSIPYNTQNTLLPHTCDAGGKSRKPGTDTTHRNLTSRRTPGPSVTVTTGTSKAQTVSPPQQTNSQQHLSSAPIPGSGKTMLLSVLTGDHPQSYTQRGLSALTLFSSPRHAYATLHLRTCIGIVSPELSNAWPCAHNMNVWEASSELPSPPTHIASAALRGPMAQLLAQW